MSESHLDPAFVLEHSAHVRALAQRLVFDSAAADDLEQETWLAALANAPRHLDSPRGWLARIASRRVVNDWRSETRRQAREQSRAKPEAVASSEELLEREELRAGIVRAVLALEEPYRGALVAQFLEERTPRDAAEARAVPVETHRTQVKRALEVLRARLQREHGSAYGVFQLALVRDLRLEPPVWATVKAAGAAIAVGGLSLWTTQLAGAAVLVVLLALGITRPWESADSPSAGDAGAAPRATLDRVPAVVSPDSGPARPPSSGRTSVPMTPLVSAIARTSAESAVRARVVDGSGRPLAGARATLTARGLPGETGASAAPVYEAESDADGVVRVVMPSPAGGFAVLLVDGGPYRTLGEVRFDPLGLDPLLPGEHDAGEIVLHAAGRIAGRVVSGGAALPNVGVRPSTEPSERRGARSGPDGHFSLDHLPPGTGRLEFALEGYLRRAEPVDVATGAVLDLGVVELEPAPSIECLLVDDAGVPVEGVWVTAGPVGSSGGGAARSAADGRLRIFVERSVPHDLELERDARFFPWGGPSAPGARVTPGDPELRIVLERIPLTRFRVVASDGGQPLAEFGLAIRPGPVASRESDSAEYAPGWPAVGAHPGAELELPAAPGAHEAYVAAPGFVPQVAPVLHDVPGTPVQTLRLEPGARVRGRLVQAGVVVPSAQVRLERALVPLGPAPRVPGRVELGRTHRWDLASFPGRARTFVTGADGTFAFDDLAAGTYELTVVLDGAIRHTRDLLPVAARADVDLGDVRLERGATIAGRLEAGSSSPVGWMVAVQGREPVRVEREDGHFVLERLSPGETVVRWHRSDTIGLEEVHSASKSERELRLVLAEGETRDVVLDASAVAPARVELVVRVDGEPLANGVVRVARREGSTTQIDGGGRTDARGTWSTRVRPGLEIAVQVQSPEGLPLASTGPWIATAGEERRIDLAPQTGEVVIEFPASYVLPDTGSVQANLSAPDGPSFLGSGPRWDRVPPTDGTSSRAWTGRRLALGRCAAGDWTLTATVFQRVPNGDRSWRHELLLPRLERDIRVRPGEVTVVEMR